MKTIFALKRKKLLNFFGVLSLSDYQPLPGEQHYWSNQPDMGVSIVSKVLSKKRFLSIKSRYDLVTSSGISVDLMDILIS